MRAVVSAEKSRVPWGALWTGLGALIVWHCWMAGYNHDELEHLHASWLVASGQLPYRDFLEQHHPALWFLAAPVVSRFTSPVALIFAARLFGVACAAAVLAIARALVRRLYPQVPWRLPVLLLLASFIFVRFHLEFRPDPLMNVALCGGLLLWVAFLQEERPWQAAAAGALMGIAIAVLQKAGIVVALAGMSGVLLVALRLRSRRPAGKLAAGLALLGACAALPVAALFASMYSLGIWKDFWFWNYPFNQFFYLQTHLREHFSIVETAGLNLACDPLLWIAGGAGAWLCARELWRGGVNGGRDEARLSLLVIGAGYFGLLCVNRFPFHQYFIVLLPLLAVFAAEAFAALRSEQWRVRFTRAALLMPAILAAILALYPRNAGHREVQRFVLAHTLPSQAIFVPPPFNPVFRRDGSYFWYNGALIGGAYEDYCRFHPDCPGDKLALEERRWHDSPPAFVLLDVEGSLPFRWEERKDAYAESPIPRLWQRRDQAAVR